MCEHARYAPSMLGMLSHFLLFPSPPVRYLSRFFRYSPLVRIFTAVVVFFARLRPVFCFPVVRRWLFCRSSPAA
ncbi:hypothetical protein HOY80DRAFT_939052, partial [Tuber brumale]